MAFRFGINVPKSIEVRLAEIEQRLDRLERLAFVGFQDVRDVAEYSFQNVFRKPEDVKRLSWTRRDFHPLSDKEAIATGVAPHELAALKMTMKTLRRQTRLDVLRIVRDILHRPKESSGRKAA